MAPSVMLTSWWEPNEMFNDGGRLLGTGGFFKTANGKIAEVSMSSFPDKDGKRTVPMWWGMIRGGDVTHWNSYGIDVNGNPENNLIEEIDAKLVRLIDAH